MKPLPLVTVTDLCELAPVALGGAYRHRHWSHRFTALQELEKRRQASQRLLPFVELLEKNYQTGWFHELLCERLDRFIQQVARKESPRLIIEVPPRHGKSVICSMRLPAFVLGQHPDWEVICASYNQTLADKFGRIVRDTLTDPIYQDMFPSTKIDPATNSVSFVATLDRGSYSAVGVGGPITGTGAHIMVIDDPVKNAEEANSETVRDSVWEWYKTTARTRLAPGGGMLIVQTRWHEDDLAGRLQAMNDDAGHRNKWELLSFPAIATKTEQFRDMGEALHPERWSLPLLHDLRAETDARTWASLYQQDPSPDTGLFFERSWIKRREPLPGKDGIWYITTDYAIGQKQTNDYTCLLPFCVHLDRSITFASPVLARLTPHEIIERLLDLVEKYKPRSIAVEDMMITKAIGAQLNTRMRERGLRTHIWTGTPSKDKQTRASGIRARMQQGEVYFAPGSDLDDVIESQIIPFPSAKHDDFVDCMSWAAIMLDKLMLPPAPASPSQPDPSTIEGTHDWFQARTPGSTKPAHRIEPLRGPAKPGAGRTVFLRPPRR